MTRPLSRLLLTLCLAVATVAGALAQSVRWDPPGGTLGVGQTTQLSLIFDDCEPNGELSLPKVPNLSYGVPMQSSQTSINNFKMSRRIVYTYGVLPIQRGPLEIPSFTVETDRGNLTVPAARFEVGEATVGQSQISIKNVAESQLTMTVPTLWAGEVFDLHYRLLISRRFNPVKVGAIDWQAPPNLVVEPWGKVETISMNVGNDVRVGVAASTRALAPDAGTITLPTAKQLIELQTGAQSFGFFAAPSTETYQIESVAPTFTVKPLPANPPAGFLKGVGQLQFSSRVIPTTTTVGEPITWTLKLEGVGNWPSGLSLPAREAPKNFQVLRPQTQRTMKENSLFEGALTEDVVLVPTQPGTYRLGAVTYTYFDPKAGRYQTVRTDPVQIEVKAAATAPAVQTSTPGAPVIQFSVEPPTTKSAAPTLPNRLPLAPLAGAASAWRPLERVAPWLLVLPLVPVVAMGLVLGRRRARLTDPRRRQREALEELRVAFAAAAAANDREAQLALVTTWQRLTPEIWAARSATPSPHALHSAIAREQPGAEAAEWVALWREADAFRFGREATLLPENWRVRAAGALQAVRLPPLAWHSGIKLGNLVPVIVGAGLLALTFSGSHLQAAPEDPLENYKRGEFAAAEKAWRIATSTEPADWKARHNLGLALAQQDKWSEAAAQWSAAFLVAPREPSLRWNLDVGLTKAEFTQPELIAFATGKGVAGFARFASPAEWQGIAIAGSVAIGLGFAVWLLSLHRARRPSLFVTGITLVVAGLLGIAASYSALRVYGVLAKPDAVLIWKSTELRTIPTEAGQQKNEPLAAGTLARVTRSFLGWQQLTLANGQTGWVRKETLVFFYR